MQVLRHDFGAKRAFVLAALRPAGLLIYFQDFRSFSNPGIRRFLTDLDPPPACHTVGVCSLSTSTLSILTRYHTRAVAFLVPKGVGGGGVANTRSMCTYVDHNR